LRCSAGLIQRRQEDANKHCDDANHNQEFNQREGTSETASHGVSVRLGFAIQASESSFSRAHGSEMNVPPGALITL
jgi:hypothetical protein